MSFQSSRLRKSAKPMVSNSEDSDYEQPMASNSEDSDYEQPMASNSEDSDYEPVQKLPSKKKRKPMDDDDLPLNLRYRNSFLSK